MHYRHALLLTTGLVLTMFAGLRAENPKTPPKANLAAGEWTRFRGPNGTGVSLATTIPVKWTEKDFNWRVPLPGVGHSQPVVWGDKVFVTSATNDGRTRLVLGLSTETGKLLWEKPYEMDVPKKHALNSFASSTPTVDDKHVYVTFSDPGHYLLVALDHAGQEVWRYDLGPFEAQHSDGTSPILFENLVILGNEQDGASFLLALDRNKGEVVWRTPRRADKVAYSTPMVYEPNDGPPQLIFNSGAYGVSSVEARTGKPLWEAPLFTLRSCSSPILAGGNLFGTCGAGNGGNFLIAIKPGGSGNVSETHLAYKLDKASMVPYVPTPVANGDLLFLWTDKGVVSCVEAATGKQVWQKRVGGTFWGSPIRVQDRLYNMSADGECIVLSATDTFAELAKNPLGEASHSTLCVAGGRMYLRTFGHLISIGGK